MVDLDITNRIPFLLEKNVRLRARASFVVLIPAAIVEPGGTPLGELIKLSNENTEIELSKRLKSRVKHLQLL